ncbi:hypothetical protein C8R43DRAFT_667903 [Mycena crocata]|nr:hypothetical protein C8R43DRAFT_667903 [Mycena crocata]
MSPSPQARRAHIRHANRAGGFGAFDSFTSFFDFPGFGNDETTTKDDPRTHRPGQETLSSASVATVSSASVLTTSSSIPTTSSSTISTSSTVQTSTGTTTSVRVTTTASGTALHDNITRVITHIASATISAAPATSSSALPAPTNALVAPVVGGVAGGVLGLAGLVFLVTFCMRRRRKDDEAINFDPGSFRRSAMLIEDPPTHQDTVARGYNPPSPPVMMERQQIYPANSNYNASHDGLSPTSGNPLYPGTFSPIASHNAASPTSAYDHSWGAPAPVLTRNTSASSAASVREPAQYPALPTQQNNNNNLSVPQNDDEYLDLERTSVTPFQAAQYVEISKRLNTEVPTGLDTPAVNEFVVAKMPAKDEDLPPLPPKDPFADAPVDSHEDEDEEALPMVEELTFPAPPSPVHTTSSRYRVDSTPPMLPEIIVHPRVSVTSTYISEGGSPSPLAAGFPAGQTVLMKSPYAESPMGSRFPVTPSPLASTFSVPTPPAEHTTFPAAPAAAQRPDPKQRQSTYTLYDPEDAYGGI